MDTMDEFYRKIQMLLMKKNQEYGDELQYLTSRTTEANIANIEDICTRVAEIFQSYNLLPQKIDLKLHPECVQSFKYLILNTNFETQNHLAEDMVNGHLVDMCPPLSPYLLIQILWKLKYDEILVQSLLFLPIQLSNELLEITRKCIKELEFERATNILFGLVLNIYKKIRLMGSVGSQVAPETTLSSGMDNLLINFQEVVSLLLKPKIIQLNELSGLKKYERYGIMLKKTLRVIKHCLENSIQEVEISPYIEKLYKITYGREAFITCDEVHMKQYMLDVNHELMNLLLKQIQVIDCNIYLGWAELEDKENNAISLQRSIGVECYYFLQFIKDFETVLPQDEHLMECLNQFSSKPKSEETNSVLTIQEIKHNINEGRKDLIHELLCRYKEWDQTKESIDYIDEIQSLLDKDECLYLLEYLTYILAQSNENDFQQHAYTVVMKILLLQSIPDIYEILIRYITKHDGRNCLESPDTEETFKNFITKNTNIRTAKTLRTVLLFVLKCPEKILTILVRIAIGCTEYKNIMIAANDMLLLSPVMSICREDCQTFLMSVLKNICIENSEWDMKKFMDFIRVMSDHSVLDADDLINKVFIPYFTEGSLNMSNMNSVLNVIRRIKENCASRTDVLGLLICLGKQMSATRKYTTLSKYARSEIITRMIRIIEYFIDQHSDRLNNAGRRAIINGLEAFLEPIDKPYFASVWVLTQEGLDVSDIVQDYERRCFAVINKMKVDQELPQEVQDLISDLGFLREDFLRHVIMRSTETEYIRHGMEITVLCFLLFNWNDQVHAYDNFCRVTTEACSLYLDYPSIGPPDSFMFLVKCLVRFTKLFLKIDCIQKSHVEDVYKSLMKNIRLLNESIKNSPYSALYVTLLTRMNNTPRDDPVLDKAQALLQALDQFETQCSELDIQDHEQKTPPAKTTRFCIAHDFISNCLNVPTPEAYECITKMDRRLFP